MESSAPPVFDDIPVLDFEPFLEGGAADRAHVAALLSRHLADPGFMLLKNHGIPPRLRADLDREARRFFALPQAEKERVLAKNSISSEGYMGPGDEQLDTGQPHDLKEIFDITSDLGQDPENPLHGPTPWPERPEFRSSVEAYHDVMCHFSKTHMHACLALGLGLPEDYFSQFFAPDRSVWRLRLALYPSARRPVRLGQLHCGAHTDFGLLTFVDAARPGLEVRLGDEASPDWHGVPARPGHLFINIGEMLMRWTNGRLKASYHRVVNRSLERDRLSFTHFEYPAFDTVLSCLPTCRDDDQPPRFKVMTVGEYLADRGWAGPQSPEGAKRWGEARPYQSGWSFDDEIRG